VTPAGNHGGGAERWDGAAGLGTLALLLERLIAEVQGLRSDRVSQSTPAVEKEDPEGLWDANRVARYLGCSKSWVYDAESAGRLPSLHIGGMLRFDPKAIRALAQAQSGTRGRIFALKR
jgi:predicted DNA-binding transcriptional regulator AlpA